MKRKLSLLLVMAMLMMSLVGCSSKDSASNDEVPTLVISHWGFNEDLLWEHIFTPFEKEFGVKIVLETGNNSERLTKLKTNPNSNIDIVYLAESFAQEGIDAGLFEKIDYSKIPNAQKCIEQSKYLIEQGFGPAYTLNRMAIAYDPAKVDIEIDSWEDLWDASLEGKISLSDITSTFGPATLYLASEVAGVDITTDNGQAAIEKLAELKNNLVKTHSKSSDLANMFANGEVALSPSADFAYTVVKEACPDVKFVDPKEGSYLNFNTINIVKGSKNAEIAHEFINFVLSLDIQTTAANFVDESPINSEVELSDEIAERLTYGQKIEGANVIDHKFVNENKAQWIDVWNRTLNK